MSRDFPGTSNNYLRINNPLGALDIANIPMTLAAWVFPRSTSIGLNQVAGKEPAVVGAGGYVLGNGRAAVIDNARGTDTVSAPSITANVWQHWVMLKRLNGADGLRFYLNGAQVATTTSNRSVPDNSAGFTIGARDLGDLGFNGLIQEVAVWNVALTDAEIASLAKGLSPQMVRRTNLAGHYPMWGTSSAGEEDLSGGTQSLTEVGTVGVGAPAPAGPFVLL